MDTEKHTILKLIDKYLSGKGQPSERMLVEEYYDRMSSDGNGLPDLSPEHEAALKERIYNDIRRGITIRRTKPWNTSFFKALAAILITVIATSFYFFLPIIGDKNISASESTVQDNDIAPGTNRATLALADGRVFDLDDATVGQIAETSGVKVIKTTDGQLVYQLSDDKPLVNADPTLLNTIATPKAGQYQVVLPDGTKVWLNSASSIRYPSRFSEDERHVEITGEAYFEVTSDKKWPFFVKSEHQKIEVLGTHFNVNAYSDEENTTTTLSEGSVRVFTDGTQTAMLRPNQQAILNNHRELTIVDVQADDVLAWKNGRFVFNNTNIELVMRMISRWYDVDIEYKNGIPEKTIGGDISKFEHISQLLEVLEATGGIQFNIEGRRIIVM